MLSVLLAYKRPVDKQKTKNGAEGGGNKKFRLRRTKILSFLLAYKRPVDKQKTQKNARRRLKFFRVFTVYTMGKHNNKRAAGAKTSLF